MIEVEMRELKGVQETLYWRVIGQLHLHCEWVPHTPLGLSWIVTCQLLSYRKLKNPDADS